jgi:hypothetical protein
MLSVDKSWRRRGIGELFASNRGRAHTAASKLVELAISEMKAGGAHEVHHHSLWLRIRLTADRT